MFFRTLHMCLAILLASAGAAQASDSTFRPDDNVGWVVNRAQTAGLADRAYEADHAARASEADHAARASEADHAARANYADGAGYASRAAYADKAGYADRAGYADVAGYATTYDSMGCVGPSSVCNPQPPISTSCGQTSVFMVYNYASVGPAPLGWSTILRDQSDSGGLTRLVSCTSSGWAVQNVSW